MRLFIDIWTSFRAMPLWVQVWVFGVLVPVNMVAVLFVFEPGGWWVAVLAVGGMTPNAVLLAVERGFSKGMALSHVLLWVPLVLIILIWLLGDPAVQGVYRNYLWALLAVDLVSLSFDIIDSVKWLRGDRDISRT